MVLKKRHSINAEEDGSKRRRKDEVCEKPEVKKKSKKGKEYPVDVVEKRSSDDDYDEDDPGEEDDNKVTSKPEIHSTLPKDDNYGIGWPQDDLIELFNKIEANIPANDKSVHTTRIENLDWDAVAFNNYSPAECKAVWMEVHKRIRHFRLLSEIIADARVWVHQPWVSFYKGKTKFRKHPECPRRPLGTFFLYCNAKKSKVTAQNPNLDMPQITSILAQMYHALPKNKKAKYEKMAEDLKKEYEEKLRIFHERYPDAEREEKEARSAARPRSKAPKAPPKLILPAGVTKPISPKQMFVKDRCEKWQNEPSYVASEAKIKAGLLWDSLSDKKKVVWIKRAAEEENQFIEKLKLYISENPEFEVPSVKSVLKKTEVELLRRSKGLPVKPASSGYVVYTRIMLQQCPDLKAKLPKDRLKEISLRWQRLSESEKEEYKEKARYEKEQYGAEMATYMESLPEDERREYLLKSQTFKGSIRSSLKAKTKDAKANNGKISKTKKGLKKERQYFPGEPHQPPLKAFDLFVDSFVSDTKLSATEAPRFWDMLPANDKAKFQRKLAELKDKYIKDYKKFLKSLNEEEVAKYNELQKRNKQIEASAGANEAQRSSADDSDEGSSSEEEDNDENAMKDTDSDENNEAENKKSESSSDSSSSSSESSSDSSSSDDSDSSSDDSDDEDKNTPQTVVKEEESDSDSSDDD